MKGTSHMMVGAITGVGVGLVTESSPSTLCLFAGVGAISGLIPDLDLNGKLSNKITLKKEVVKIPLILIGIGIIMYTLFQSLIGLTGFDLITLLSVLCGLSLIFIAKKIKQKRMLTFSGIGIVLLGALAMNMTTWVVLLGIYVIVASYLPHRGYTHSILGLIFFAVIMYLAQTSLNIDGLFLVGTLGYISHLICDMKFIPFNRKGVKLLAPFIKNEF